MWCFYVVAVIGAIDLVRIASASQTAFVEIRFCKKTKQSANTRTRKLRGTFTNIGSLTQAKGDVLQIHPFGLCNISNDDSFYNDEWVGVVKLTVPSQESPACNGTVQKALGAVRKGAKAVIFDITDSPGAAKELNSKRNLISHPVIIISGASAKKLMRIVNEQKVLKAKISLYPDIDQTKENAGEYVDMVIFMTCFVLITVICFILLLKIKWRQSKKESSLAKMAFDAVSKMESKKYEEKKGVEAVKTINEKQWERKLSVHSCSVAGISCVICLEEFKEGQEIRVVSCGHEFHLTCVDPWLLTNYTCPLCMLNIVEREGNGIKTESRCSLSFRSLFSCCFASSPLTSSSMVYSVTMEEPGNDVSSVSNDTVESLQFNSLDINSSHASWTERLPARPSGDSQIWRASQGRDVSSGAHISSLGRHSVPCLTSKEKDISLLSVNASDSSPEGSFTETLDAERLQRQENRAKAVQIADLGIRKYAELGDAV